MSDPAPLPVAAPGAVAAGALVPATANPSDGAQNVHIAGGSIATQATTTTTLNALADVTVTTTPTALGALAAGPKGLLVRSDVDNDPASRIRVASNADATHGVVLAPGESFTFESIANASELLVCLKTAVAGAATLEVEQA